MFHIDKKVQKKYPDTSFGRMIIKINSIQSPLSELTSAKKQLEVELKERFSNMTKKELFKSKSV